MKHLCTAVLLSMWSCVDVHILYCVHVDVHILYIHVI